MTHYFSFPLDHALQAAIDNLLAEQAQGRYASPETSIRLATGTTDGIIKALALDVIAILRSDGEGAGILDVLARLLKSTMHVLIKQIMGKVDRGEQDRLAVYLQHRRIVVDGQTRFGFIMSDDTGERFQKLLGRIMAGDLTNVRSELTTAMNGFIDLAVTSFYDEFTGALDLGLIKRKLVDVGRGTIIKGSQTAVARLFASMSDEDLGKVAAHYTTMFVKA